MKFSIKFIMAFIFLSLSGISYSQVGVGADFVSRYIWRGLDFGNTPAVQPSLSATFGAFEIGSWGSFTLSNQASGSDELDLYLSYSIPTDAGDIGIILNDYYFPNAGGKFFNYNNYDDEDGAGSHLLEAGLTFTGTESFPLTLSAFMNFYNDADNSAYFEVAYSTNVEDVALDLFIGATPGGDNFYYATDKFNVINMGIKASREIKISDSFSLPIFGSYVLNPNLEIAYFVFGFSL